MCHTDIRVQEGKLQLRMRILRTANAIRQLYTLPYLTYFKPYKVILGNIFRKRCLTSPPSSCFPLIPQSPNIESRLAFMLRKTQTNIKLSIALTPTLKLGCIYCFPAEFLKSKTPKLPPLGP